MVKEVKYSFIKKLDDVEIRLYNSLIIAKVDGYGDAGFNLLFNYISGNNTQKANLEMTSPVLSQNIEMTAPVLSEKDSIAFVIPEEYTIETTPNPNDERIKIQHLPERYVAALRFTGRWTSSNFTRKSKKLLEKLRKSNIRTKGDIFGMRYSGPLTPWFLRRNEVAIEVDFKQ
ncbi:MAG: heme-binding protein [Candidatus Bathyarchaeota archaeon]|nr:MAG: heme-binding protein [Candidatus Bathyarchaeota archaeon]